MRVGISKVIEMRSKIVPGHFFVVFFFGIVVLAGDQWWPFFCNILFSCNQHIALSDSIFWFNKLGVNVGILLSYFFK